MVPDLFFIQTLIPEIMPVDDYDMSLGDTYADRLVGDDLGEGFTGIGELIGLTGSVVAAFITFIITIALSVWTARKGWGAEIGLMGGGLVMICMALLVGDIVFGFMMILSLVAGIGVVWLTLLKKA